MYDFVLPSSQATMMPLDICPTSSRRGQCVAPLADDLPVQLSDDVKGAGYESQGEERS